MKIAKTKTELLKIANKPNTSPKSFQEILDKATGHISFRTSGNHQNTITPFDFLEYLSLALENHNNILADYIITLFMEQQNLLYEMLYKCMSENHLTMVKAFLKHTKVGRNIYLRAFEYIREGRLDPTILITLNNNSDITPYTNYLLITAPSPQAIGMLSSMGININPLYKGQYIVQTLAQKGEIESVAYIISMPYYSHVTSITDARTAVEIIKAQHPAETTLCFNRHLLKYKNLFFNNQNILSFKMYLLLKKNSLLQAEKITVPFEICFVIAGFLPHLEFVYPLTPLLDFTATTTLVTNAVIIPKKLKPSSEQQDEKESEQFSDHTLNLASHLFTQDYYTPEDASAILETLLDNHQSLEESLQIQDIILSQDSAEEDTTQETPVSKLWTWLSDKITNTMLLSELMILVSASSGTPPIFPEHYPDDDWYNNGRFSSDNQPAALPMLNFASDHNETLQNTTFTF